MSRCARCGQRRWMHNAADSRQPAYWPYGCHLFTPRDPWWIRTLARLGKGRR
jgi:hypothetical protein